MASSPCRKITVRIPVTLNYNLSNSHLADTLRDLCAMGMVEKFTDEDGVVRYRPAKKAVAA